MERFLVFDSMYHFLWNRRGQHTSSISNCYVFEAQTAYSLWFFSGSQRVMHAAWEVDAMTVATVTVRAFHQCQ
jgi:hypothetical protein